MVCKLITKVPTIAFDSNIKLADVTNLWINI
jgi:hypothetical protein